MVMCEHYEGNGGGRGWWEKDMGIRDGIGKMKIKKCYEHVQVKSKM